MKTCVWVQRKLIILNLPVPQPFFPVEVVCPSVSEETSLLVLENCVIFPSGVDALKGVAQVQDLSKQLVWLLDK